LWKQLRLGTSWRSTTDDPLLITAKIRLESVGDDSLQRWITGEVIGTLAGDGETLTRKLDQ
jgi:hypothetical protein